MKLLPILRFARVMTATGFFTSSSSDCTGSLVSIQIRAIRVRKTMRCWVKDQISYFMYPIPISTRKIV